MKTKLFLTFFGFFLCCSVLGQNWQKYYELRTEAFRLYEGKEYLKSGQKYSEAFAVYGNKSLPEDRYNAACSWALANEIDSALVQLFNIAEKGNFKGYDHMITDMDLRSLYKDRRWNKVVKIVKSNKEKAEATIDKSLAATLDTVYLSYFEYRNQINVIAEKYGRESPEYKSLQDKMAINDSMNIIKVKAILDRYGWLGTDIVGEPGNAILWLVIQDSDLSTQEKYLPMMREAFKNGKASGDQLAYLEDRFALRQGKRQIYGSFTGRDTETNLSYVLPLDDPDNVDKRRFELGLSPLSDYLSIYQIVWDVEQYKKDLPSIEAKENEKQKF
jgi:hypothetical protein